MAGRLGTVHGLIFGLVVVAAGSAVLSPASNAESSGNRIAQGVPSVFAAPAQPNPQAQPARAGSPAQEAPTPEQVKAIAHVQTCLTELGLIKVRSTASAAARPGPPIEASSTTTGLAVTAICSPSPCGRSSTSSASRPPRSSRRLGKRPSRRRPILRLSLSLQANRTWPRMKARVWISTACPTI